MSIKIALHSILVTCPTQTTDPSYQEHFAHLSPTVGTAATQTAMKAIETMISAVVVATITTIGLVHAQATTVDHAAMVVASCRRSGLRRGDGERILQAATMGRLTGLNLINANTGARIATLVNNSVIAVNIIPGMTAAAFNINAKRNRLGGLGYNGTSKVWTANAAAYAFCGNNGPQFFGCALLGVVNRTHVVTATP
jgi:hypothetical protein